MNAQAVNANFTSKYWNAAVNERVAQQLKILTSLVLHRACKIEINWSPAYCDALKTVEVTAT